MTPARTLYNNDGTYLLSNALHGGRPLTVADVHDYVDRIHATPVTTYLICTNSLQTYYYGALDRPVGIADGSKHRPGPETRVHAESVAQYGEAVRTLHAQGTDIVTEVCRRCRELGLEVMTSQRLNDLHFTEPGVVEPAAQSEFWLDHPEYRLGSRARAGWHSRGALNWEHDAVRAHSLALATEIISRFDSDGHELDFMRFPVYFPSASAESCIPLMDSYIRAASEVSGRVAADRGRPRRLGVRIPCGLARCRAIGLDPAAWVREGWVDFITVSSFFSDRPVLAIRQFRRDLGEPDLPIYGAVDGGVASYPGRRTKTAGLHRSHAATRHAEGADGLYLFNYFFRDDTPPEVVGEAQVGHDPALIAELADPARLRGRNTVYTEGGSDSAYGSEPAFVLPVELVEGAADFHFHLAEAGAVPTQATLFLRVSEGPQGWTLRVNHQDVTPVDADPALYAIDTNARPEDHTLAFAVPPACLRDGLNHIYAHRDPDAGTVLAADLVLRHGPTATHGWF